MSSVQKDINSTEKLLNVIRGDEDASFHAQQMQKNARFIGNPGKKGNLRTSRWLGRKKYTVGIDIGEKFICLAKVNASETKPVLVDRKIIRYDSVTPGDSPQFKAFLKSVIFDFCKSVTDCDIWTKIATSQVNIYFLHVPRVPKNQLEKVIFWTAKKEGFIDEEKNIFDFEMQGEIVEQGTPKYSVMVYTAPKVEIERIKSFFSDIGITLTGITTVPFAIQNIFRSRWMPVSEDVFASLFIGNNFSRIDVYHKENLVMTRGIKTGSTSSMAEAIISSVLEKTGGVKLSQEEAKNILASLVYDSKTNKEMRTSLELKREDILQMIAPVMERLVRQVDLTLKTSSFIESQKVEKIYIRSSVNVDRSISDYISDQLGIKTEFLNPFDKKKTGSPTEFLNVSEEMLLSPALGFALSDNKRTPNALFTYREKHNEMISARINKVIFLCFAAALIICLGTLAYQGSKLNMLRNKKMILETELALYSPPLTVEHVMKTANEVKMNLREAHLYVQKYSSFAAIGEISRLTPSYIQLISFSFKEGAEAQKTDADKPVAERSLSMEGIVQGNRDGLDSYLTQYVIALENSLLFGNVSVQKKEVVSFNKRDVIHFVLNAKVNGS